ncbi:MAG: hypothetical protein AMXMBFR7_38610 [Planctomycetota bacterium]
MTKRAMVVFGGWKGHEPDLVAKLFESILKDYGFGVEMSETLDSLKDLEKLKQLNLIVPVWTMGSITGEQESALLKAVEAGVGIGGCHGGMCDSFRNNTGYQWMTGGQWVAHPGNDGTKYTVKITDPNHFITRGMSDFEVSSEQYYMHIDPAIKVQAVTRFPVADGPHSPNGPVDMPQVWTKYYGQGRVFYCALGHKADVLQKPEPKRICARGLLWAAKAEELAKD